MAAKKEERDESPTRLTHVNGATVVVPAYKAEGLVDGGQFTAAKKAAAKTAAQSEK